MHFSWYKESKPKIEKQLGKIKGDPIIYMYYKTREDLKNGKDCVYDFGIDDSDCPYSYSKETGLHTKWCEEETKRVYGC